MNMKIGEVKIRISNTIIDLIDTYFSGNALNEKFINSTLKILLKQNINKIDNMLNLFADKDGEINLEEIISEYMDMIGDDSVVFDLKNYVNNELVKNIIPDKVLVIKREDIAQLLN